MLRMPQSIPVVDEASLWSEVTRYLREHGSSELLEDGAADLIIGIPGDKSQMDLAPIDVTLVCQCLISCMVCRTTILIV